MIKEVTMYKTDDGRAFDTLHDADRHEAAIRFIEWYESDEGDQLQGIFAEEMSDWIQNNADQIRPMMQV
jgi:hypothetical protein